MFTFMYIYIYIHDADIHFSHRLFPSQPAQNLPLHQRQLRGSLRPARRQVFVPWLRWELIVGEVKK